MNITLLPITNGVDMKALVKQLVSIRSQKGDDICLIDSEFITGEFGELNEPDVTLPRGKVSLGISLIYLILKGRFWVPIKTYAFKQLLFSFTPLRPRALAKRGNG